MSLCIRNVELQIRQDPTQDEKKMFVWNTVARLDDKLRHNVVSKAVEEYLGVPARRISGQSEKPRLIYKELAGHVCVLSVDDKKRRKKSSASQAEKVNSVSSFSVHQPWPSTLDLIVWRAEATEGNTIASFYEIQSDIKFTWSRGKSECCVEWVRVEDPLKGHPSRQDNRPSHQNQERKKCW